MNAEPSRQQMHRRYRRRILSWGAAVVIGVFVLGSAITMPRVETELEQRVDDAVVAAGLRGLTSSFSGQDGTLHCTSAHRQGSLSSALLDELRGLRGVRRLDVDAECSGDASATPADEEPATTAAKPVTDPVVTDADGSTPADSTPADSAPVDSSPDDSVPPEGDIVESLIDVVRNDSQFSTLAGLIDDAGLAETLGEAAPRTLFAPTDDAFQALGPDVIAALSRDPESLTAVLAHHVSDSVLRADDLVAGEIEMLDGTAITINAGEASVGAQLVSGQTSAMLTAVDIDATNGIVHGIDGVLLPPGFALPDPTTSTTVPDVATDEAAAQLEAELNALVAANPILFEQGSAEITLASLPAIAQIAELATRLDGFRIEVQGHTDTDGDPVKNQTLSEDRAAAVLDGLVAAGVPADIVASSGFGGTRTIVDANGVEDKAASRRVEFVVTVQ